MYPLWCHFRQWFGAPLLPLPRNGVFNHTENVVVWSDGPALLVRGVGDVELAILLIIGVECQA